MTRRMIFVASLICGWGSTFGWSQSTGGALPPEAVAEEVTFRGRGEVFVSPDGAWVAYVTSKPGQTVALDHPDQLYSRTGYPLSAGTWLADIWVANLTTGETRRIGSDVGSSWAGAWSPDGKRFAFYSDRTGVASVWIWDQATSQSRQLSNALVHPFFQTDVPLWSPDGKQILTKLVVEGMTIDDVFRLSPSFKPADSAKTAPDPNKAAVHVFHASAKSAPPPLAASTALPVPASASGAVDESSEEPEAQGYMDYYFLSDLALIDAQTGVVKRIVKRTRPSWYAFSPDGQSIAFATQQGIRARSQTSVFSLLAYSMKDASTRTLVRNISGDLGPRVALSWSPDSTRIAYATSGVRSDHACYIVRPADGSITKVSAAIPAGADDFAARPPMWGAASQWLYLLSVGTGKLWKVSADGASAREAVKIPDRAIRDVAFGPDHHTYWSPGKGDNMMVLSLDRKTNSNGFYQVDLASGQAVKISESGMRNAYIGGGAKESSRFVYEAEDVSHAPDLWTLDAAGKQDKKLSKLNPRYDAAAMGSSRIVEWISMAGEPLRGTLVTPAGYQEGKRYPTVVWAYGGMNGADYWNAFGLGWGAAFNAQMWASRGYAVFFLEVRMHKGTPVEDLVSAVIPGINKLVELGLSDPEKFAISGQSFGGYNTMSLITHSSRFKAAIASASAFINLFEGYSYFAGEASDSTGYYEEGQGSIGGTPWQMRERYIENSPYFDLDKVTTPVLLECGKDDDLCTGSGEMFISLRRLGKEVDLVQYDGEGHVPLGRANVIDFWNRRIEFVDRQLGVTR